MVLLDPKNLMPNQDTHTNEWLVLTQRPQQSDPFPWVRAVSRRALTASPQLVRKPISCQCPTSLFFAKTKTTAMVIMFWCHCTTMTLSLTTPRHCYFMTGKQVDLVAFRTQTFILILRASTSKANSLNLRRTSPTVKLFIHKLQATPSQK